MRKHVVFFTCTCDTWARMIKNPGDWTGAGQLADGRSDRNQCHHHHHHCPGRSSLRPPVGRNRPSPQRTITRRPIP
jgi:hypothetical protein